VSHDLPEVSEPSAALDPCAAARCEHQAERSIPLVLGGEPTDVPLCEKHAVRWAAAARSSPPSARTSPLKGSLRP
jgi:uncharacterized protein (DUF2126 family)